MSKEIDNAVKLLRDNGYAVKKLTNSMKKDSQKCAELSAKGKEMECFGCACSICIAQ